MTTNNPEVIYLIDTGDGVAWCDDPDPTGYGECNDAVKYVRGDAYEALQAEFVIRLDELSARNYELRMGLAEKTSECEKLRKVMSDSYIQGSNDCHKAMTGGRK